MATGLTNGVHSAKSHSGNPDTSGAEKDHVLDRLNEHYGRDILDFVRYYGNCPGAQHARVLDLDIDTITIRWSRDIDGSVTEETRQFDINKQWGPATTMRRVMDMAHDAHRALLMRRAREMSSMEERTPVIFKLPPMPIVVAIIGGYFAMWYLATTSQQNLITEWVHWIFPPKFFHFVLVSLAIVHSAEALIMFLACRRYRRSEPHIMGLGTQLQYTLSTLVFGFFSAIQFTRQAFKHSDLAMSVQLGVEEASSHVR